MNYLRSPLELISDIPVFSERDNYIINYEKISQDHLKSLEENNGNPFMLPEQIKISDEKTRDVITRSVQRGSAILDAGIGLGGLVAELSGYECHGVDISMPYLKKARTVCPKVIMAKLEELPYCDDSFDAVICCDVLEHLFGLDSASEQLVRIIKPGGKLIVRVPNNEPLDFYLNDTSYNHSHVRTFTLTSLRLYFERCFGLIYQEHEFVCYNFLHFQQMRYCSPPKQVGLMRKLSHVLGADPSLANLPEFKTLLSLASVSFEEQGDHLLAIRDMHRAIFEILKGDLIHPLGLVAVFQKRSSLPH